MAIIMPQLPWKDQSILRGLPYNWTMPLRVVNVLYLGRVDYAIALELQQTLVRLVKEGRISHTLLLLEHPPVITLGRNAAAKTLLPHVSFLR